MRNFSELKIRLLAFPEKEFGNGVDENEIKRAETLLGVQIEGGYRAFLKEFGWGKVSHFSLFGLGSGVPPYLELVRMTQSERTEMFPPIPHHLVPVMNDGGGNHYCIDTRIESEPPIVFWSHEDEPDQEPEIYGDDFVSWMNKMLD